MLFPSGTKLTRRWTCRHRARKWRTRRGCKRSRSTSWWRKFGLKMGTSSWKHLPTTVQLVSSNLFPLIPINLDQSTTCSSLIFSFKNSILLSNYFAQLALLFSSIELNGISSFCSRGRSNILQLESTIGPGHSQSDYRGHSSHCEQSIGRESVERSYETRIASLVR